MEWEETERGGHLKKFFIKMLIFLIAVVIAVITVLFLLPKKEYYSINLDGDERIVAHLYGDGKYESGKKVTIYADEVPGYTFSYWTLNGEIVSTEAEYTFIIKKETSGVYVANYEAIYYTVNMLAVYGSFSVVSTAHVGDLIEIEDITPNAGYEVSRMYYTLYSGGQDVPIVNNRFYMPAGDIRVVVEFSPTIYSIEYDLDGGEFDEDIEIVTSYNIRTANIVLPKPNKIGYDFVGWTGTDLDYVTESVVIHKGSIGNRSYTANYNLHTYNITNECGQNGSLTVNTTEQYTSIVEISVIADEGYGVSELYYVIDGTDGKFPIYGSSFEMPAGNITIYALFSLTGYSINLANTVSHGNVDIDKDSAYFGERITVRTQADTAYKFNRSYYVIDGEFEQHEFTNSFSMPSGNVTIVVEFVPVSNILSS